MSSFGKNEFFQLTETIRAPLVRQSLLAFTKAGAIQMMVQILNFE